MLSITSGGRAIALRRLLFSWFASLAVAGCGGSSGSSSPPTVAPTTGPSSAPVPTMTPTIAPQQIVGVSGTHLTLNGSPWLSRGVVERSFEQGLDTLEAGGPPPGQLAAAQSYGQAELTAIKNYGADTIRFLVSQPAFDPTSSLYDPTFAASVIAGVQLARQNGFVVLIALQTEAPTGSSAQTPLPSAVTEQIWDTLDQHFSTDRGVIYELYNEPAPDATTANWALWLNGDPSGTSAIQPYAVGMQTIVTRLRGEGSQNVIVVDGLAHASTLAGVPTVNDSLGQIVYAFHPYQHGSADESQWPEQFGNESETLPVWADEWSAEAGASLMLGSLTSYQVAVDLVNYLIAHKIPLVEGAFDFPNFVTQNSAAATASLPAYTPTNYMNFSNTNTADDSGTLVQVLYRTNYSRPLTLADGL